MKRRVIKVILDPYVLLTLILLILSLLWIHPNFKKGLVITYVSEDIPNLKPGYILKKIESVNYTCINLTKKEDFLICSDKIGSNTTVIVYYEKETLPYIYKTESLPISLGNKKLSDIIDVDEIKQTNLKYGIELGGGVRAILKPERKLNNKEINDIKESLELRLNVYGVKQVDVSYIIDYKGEVNFFVEIPRGSIKEIEDLIKKEGKLTAKIGNKTVFTYEDIVGVCIGNPECQKVIFDGKVWRFMFSIYISKKGAERFAEATKDLEVICPYAYQTRCYLDETLDLYIDEELVDSLRISADLKGKEIDSATIEGGHPNKEVAINNMKKLQAILSSKPLPVKLEITSIQEISPEYGKEVSNNLILLFLLAVIAVYIYLALIYRNPLILAALLFVCFAEIIITLGIASLIQWTMDVASLAGIIAAVGTGVNDQIVITEEVLRGKKETTSEIKEMVKKAYFIVIVGFVISIAALLPLIFSPLVFLRGFGVTTLLDLLVGVLITRPAYGRLLEKLLGKEQKS